MKITKQLNLSSQYTIDGTTIAYFYASINDEGFCSTNKNVADQDLYLTNREALNASFTEFEDEAYRLADKIKNEGI